jgi:hypothetical protein
MDRVYLALTLALISFPTLNAENWPQWRGPELDGISHEKNLPVHWSPADNIACPTAAAPRRSSGETTSSSMSEKLV